MLRWLSLKRPFCEIRSRWADLVGVYILPLLGMLLALKWLFENDQVLFIYDDSYITLGFARNLALHGTLTLDGTTFWHGMTSPLHVFLVSLLAKLFGSVEASAIFVGIASIAFLVVTMYLWVKKLTKDKNVALLASFLTASSGWIIFDALSGLETVTFLLLSVLVFYFWEKRNVYLVGLVLGLSIWARPEGWFLLVAILTSHLVTTFSNRQDRSKITSEIKQIGLEGGIALAIVVPLLAINVAYTGMLTPSTVLAKTYFFGEVNMALSTKSQFFWDAVRLWYGTLIFSSPFILVFLAFARYTRQRSYMYVYPLLFYVFYFILFPGGLGHYWCRYQHIFLPIVFLLLSEGVVNLSNVLRKRWKIIAVVLLAAVIFLNQWQSVWTGQERYKGATDSTLSVNIQVAKWLEANTDANDVIATHDIGTITYFLPQRVIDLVGLVNPEVTKYYRAGATQIAFEERQVSSYLLEKEVDYLVMFDDWRRFLNLSPEDMSSFYLVYESGAIYRSGARYWVYSLSKLPTQR
jgi:hypothetical protein